MQVSIDTHYAELVLGVCVIVGFATSLDRRVNMMDAAAPVMLVRLARMRKSRDARGGGLERRELGTCAHPRTAALTPLPLPLHPPPCVQYYSLTGRITGRLYM